MACKDTHSTSLVHEREHEARGGRRAARENELATDALAELGTDTGLLALSAWRVGVQGGRLSVTLLRVKAVLWNSKSKKS